MTDQLGVAYGAALSMSKYFHCYYDINKILSFLVLGGLLGYFRSGSLISLLLGILEYRLNNIEKN